MGMPRKALHYVSTPKAKEQHRINTKHVKITLCVFLRK
jgi:hypothetical protein